MALPSMGRGLHGSVTGLQWVVDAYTLSFAGLLLTGGALAERLGGRRVFTAGLVAAGRLGWASPVVLGGFAASAAAWAAFAAVEHRGADPMLPLRLFARRGPAVGTGAFGLVNGGQSVAVANPVNRRVPCQPEPSSPSSWPLSWCS